MKSSAYFLTSLKDPRLIIILYTITTKMLAAQVLVIIMPDTVRHRDKLTFPWYSRAIRTWGEEEAKENYFGITEIHGRVEK